MCEGSEGGGGLVGGRVRGRRRAHTAIDIQTYGPIVAVELLGVELRRYHTQNHDLGEKKPMVRG